MKICAIVRGLSDRPVFLEGPGGADFHRAFPTAHVLEYAGETFVSYLRGFASETPPQAVVELAQSLGYTVITDPQFSDT